ncbi:hypothetical protein Tco_0982024 [Tanacetum coccineum]
MYKQCLITSNHDVCVLNYVNDMNSRADIHSANVSNIKNHKKHKPLAKKPKKVVSKERLASPKPKKPRTFLRWSPTGRIFDLKGKIIASSESECQSNCSNGDNACTSNPQEPTIKWFPNSTSFLGKLSKFFLGTVYFGNDHVATILDLEVTFRRNTCFVRNLEGVDLLKGNRTTNLYTINLHEMASASPICLMARATSTKSVYNRRTKKTWRNNEIWSFDELSARALKKAVQTRLQSITSDKSYFRLDLTYAPCVRVSPEGFIDLISKPCLKVKEGSNGLKQAPRTWTKPTERHSSEVKRIFRYLRGTVNMGLWYTKDSGFELTGFSDADYAGCKDTFKSTSGGAQFLGEKLVSWSSKKQDCTALSTAKAEYVSLSACCAQVIWMRTQLTDYGYHFNKIPIYCDSKSAIAISCNPVQHSRTKHIAVRYHFIKEHVEKGTIELYFVKTDYQLADLFTKALPVDRFNYLVRRLGMRQLSPKELELPCQKSQ